jgi:hypothetical protein
MPGEAAGAEPQILASLDDERPGRHGLAHPPPRLGPQPPVPAHAVSSAVLERLPAPRRLRVMGAGRGALHLDLDGFVVTVTSAGVPLLPNAVAVGAAALPLAVAWSRVAPPAWDPVVAPVAGGPQDVAALRAWLEARVPVPSVPLRAAAARLLGRGRGLTPEGDDLLAGAAIGARALGTAAGASPGEVEDIVAALCPPDAAERTGGLSATLLDLAARGAAPEPVHRLASGRGREGALSDLRRLGASTGAALAAGLALGAGYLLGSTR